MVKRTKKVAQDDIDKVQKLDANDEMLTIRGLMAKQESNVIISDPREYQLELFERAKKENVIAVLDTGKFLHVNLHGVAKLCSGSGKTLIAVMLLKHCIDQELQDRAEGKPPRIAFFLVHSVALVFQQFAVLEANLDQPVERFCGAMHVDTFSKVVWKRHFEDNKAIVCTADILLHCLLKSFITMDQINLLIFDEAHKTKKNHAFARIIKDFYVGEGLDTRPKIFGMTASPVDAKKDPHEAAHDLETLLHCRIATASHPELVRQKGSETTEIISTYSVLLKPRLTALGEELKNSFGYVKVMQRLFRSSEIICSELGEWAADYLWQIALAEEESVKMQRRVERAFTAQENSEAVSVLSKELDLIKQAKDKVQARILPDPEQVERGISSKVENLKDLFDWIFELPNDSRVIVFVSTRYTARILAVLMHRLGNKNQRIGSLIGARSGEPGDERLTVRQQMLTLSKFRKGDLNVLFATSIAEEGLDIPDCNYVIRFDMYDTLIQCIQSRGRARRKDSKFIVMIEEGNTCHRQIIHEVRDKERIMRKFCEALPEDRMLQGNDHDFEDAVRHERHLPVYKEPTTGARFTFGSVLGTIEHFVASLRRDDETTVKATYIMAFDGGRFVCELVLPTNSPIRSVVGRPYGRKSLAKRSAAFEACLLLRAADHLDEHLLPKYHKDLPAMRNALLALNSKKSKQYKMIVKPSLWSKSWGTLPTNLYMMVVDLEDPSVLGRPSEPLAFLTRDPLIEFPRFPLWPRPGASSNVTMKHFKTPITVSKEQLKMLSTFTFRTYRDIHNKLYEEAIANISYWFAPCQRSSVASVIEDDPTSCIDWATIEFVHNNAEIAWSPEKPMSEFMGRYWVDKWDGGRRYFSVAEAPQYRALDPVPEGSPSNRFGEKGILDYSISLFKKARVRAWEKWIKDQPVFEAFKMNHRHNWLDEWKETDAKVATRCFLCPEPLLCSAIPGPYVATCYMLPALIHRMESYMIALELCEKLDISATPELALEAVTKDSDNTEEHKATQIQFQRGMGKNYERLEFIGDAFLKMATSIALYAANAKDDEFHSHVKRMLMICNKNLLNSALEKDIHEYIRSRSFNRRTWYPEGLKLLQGRHFNDQKDEDGEKKLTHPQQTHPLQDKSIADVCEALIGATLLSAEPDNMDPAVKCVTVMVNNGLFFEENDHQAERFSDYWKMYTMPEWQTVDALATHVNLVEQCAQEDPGYRFKWPRLLKAAFTHPSTPFMWEKIPCYQRLEFLGDALFDMVAIRFLFDRHPDRDPQWLTEHKMAMVSNKFLGAVCVRLGFHKHMRHLNSMLMFQISEYVTDITEAERTSGGARDYWMGTRDPPKCLPDVVEAYIGALFVDSQFDFKQVERFFQNHIRWFFEDMTIYDSFAHAHPTTTLSNLLSVSLGCANFRLMCDEIPTIDGRTAETPRIVAVVMVHDTIIADSEGTSSRYAKVKASRLAVEELKGLTRREFVGRFGCDCTETEDGQAPQPLPDFSDTAI
jgi:endoribonuclease Dicer